MTLRKVTTEDRRARLLSRHRLARNRDPIPLPEIADSVIGLHATEPTTVYLSAWARSPGITREDIDHALYEERSVVRIVGMRRTLFVVPLATAAILDRGCSRPLAIKDKQRSVKMLRDADAVPDPEGWVDRVSLETLETLRELGEATATELTDRVPDLGLKILYRPEKKWGGEIGMSTRILFLLSAEGKIVRGRPRGSWLSSQYRWSATDQWASIPDPHLSDDALEAELVQRYLDRFGPVTETDVVWWTGWTKTKTRRALSAVEPIEVELDEGGTGYALNDFNLGPIEAPTIALLPGLDATTMGWKERDWYLGDHGATLFDRRGNAGPTIWADGRIVGGWGQSPTGEVVWRLLEDIGADYHDLIEERCAELDKWLDGTVLATRFPSPFQRELARASTVEP